VVTDSTGATVGEQRYYPYGETRLTTGTIYTDKLFTGQRDMGLGIYDFNARMYDPKLGRFLSADTIVPGAGNPQAYNRYAYTLNNPLRYIDPSGHFTCSNNKNNDDYCPGHSTSGSSSPVVIPPVVNLPGGGNNNNNGNGSDYCSVYSDACNAGVAGASNSGGPVISYVPPGPSCTEVPYCYVPPESSEPYPWLPDYWVVDISIPVWLTFTGINLQPYVVDKYGNYYVAGGAGIGTSPIPGLKANFSLSGGYIFDDNTTEEEAQSFLQRATVSGCGGFVGGICGTWGNPSISKDPKLKDVALQVGLFSPQAGVSATYGLLVSDK